MIASIFFMMLNAGRAVAAEVLRRFPDVASVDVLCGPGNNGGDGYVVARLLAEAGVAVTIWADGAPRAGSDADRAAKACPLIAQSLAGYEPRPGSLVVDALYGAGLNKPLTGAAALAIEQIKALELPVVAVDLPSGVSGETGAVLGVAFTADLTVTFARKKPGHLLLPGSQSLRRGCWSPISGFRMPSSTTLRPRPSKTCRRSGWSDTRFHRPTAINIRVVMSVSSPAGRQPQGRREWRRWARHAPGQEQSPCCRRRMPSPSMRRI
jgi:hydroxyethylthiazole kinase-like uncharacterized protein yjeF